MTKTIGRGLLGLLLAGGALVAADFWDKTPDFTEWSDKDTEKMMYDSPWAKKALVARQAPQGGQGGFGGGRGGRGGGGPAGPSRNPTAGVNSGGGGDFTPPPMEFVIRWHSAAPIKEAMVRQRLGSEGGTPDEEMNAFLGRAEQYYIVNVGGLPAQMRRMAENPDRLKEMATLERKGKDPITPEKVEVVPSERAVDLFFLFPRTDAIELDDKDVEFKSLISFGGGRGGQAQGGQAQGGQGASRGLNIEKKFRLKDMVYKGKLEL